MTHWSAVSDRLVSLWADVAPEGVKVFDGPTTNNNGGRDFIIVGADEDGDAGSISFEPSPVGNAFLAETGTITCQVTGQGATDAKACRERAFALVQVLAAAVAADKTLGLLPQGSNTLVEAGVQALSNERGVAQILTVNVTYTTPF